MLRQLMTILAVVALLTQATLGAALPGAVLCIKSGEDPCMKPAPTGDMHCCCGIEKENEHAPLIMHLSPPCSTDCGDCVEVPLPDETVRAVGGITLNDTLGFLAFALQVESDVDLVHVPQHVAHQGVGPPERSRCPHAPIVASTRLNR